MSKYRSVEPLRIVNSTDRQEPDFWIMFTIRVVSTDITTDKLLNKQGPLDKQQRREAGSFVDQDQ